MWPSMVRNKPPVLLLINCFPIRLSLMPTGIADRADLSQVGKLIWCGEGAWIRDHSNIIGYAHRSASRRNPAALFKLAHYPFVTKIQR
jgi:hypothetical protein